MSYNKITIIGNLGRDPELRYTQAGKAVVNFSVATTEKWTGADGNKQEKTIWFKVVAWGKMGENASKYLFKGDPVYCEGRLQIEQWTDREGKDRQDLVCNASEIQYLKQRDSNSSGGGGRSNYDQRRPGTDDHDQRTADDALPLGNTPKGKDDDIPF